MTVSRRNILGSSAAALSLATVSVASAQQNRNDPQPMRAGNGGTDPGPRDPIRDRENPDVLIPPATDQGTLISGISVPVYLIPFKASIRMAVNSCWRSTMAAFPRTTHF